ncbi:hypothetical protein MC885_010960 [Smutsia gigantea]|nr:hypothetical protein MC885_010960 [Smutsia gigantea]
MATFHLALIQLQVSSIKSDNLTQACGLIQEAAIRRAKVGSLPECFNSPYGMKYFPEYAEKIPGESTQKLSEVAKIAAYISLDVPFLKKMLENCIIPIQCLELMERYS